MNVLQWASSLAESKEMVERAIVEHCPIPVFSATKTGEWQSVNKPLAQLLVSDSDDLLNNRWQKLLVKEESAAMLIDWKALINSEAQTGRLRFRFRACDDRLVTSYAELVKLKDGRWIGFIVPVCDAALNCPVHQFLHNNIISS